MSSLFIPRRRLFITVDDAQQRALVKPRGVGEVLFQVDTAQFYESTGSELGNWAPITGGAGEDDEFPGASGEILYSNGSGGAGATRAIKTDGTKILIGGTDDLTGALLQVDGAARFTGDITANSGIVLGGVRQTSWPSATIPGVSGDVIYSDGSGGAVAASGITTDGSSISIVGSSSNPLLTIQNTLTEQGIKVKGASGSDAFIILQAGDQTSYNGGYFYSRHTTGRAGFTGPVSFTVEKWGGSTPVLYVDSSSSGSGQVFVGATADNGSGAKLQVNGSLSAISDAPNDGTPGIKLTAAHRSYFGSSPDIVFTDGSQTSYIQAGAIDWDGSKLLTINGLFYVYGNHTVGIGNPVFDPRGTLMVGNTGQPYLQTWNNGSLVGSMDPTGVMTATSFSINGAQTIAVASETMQVGGNAVAIGTGGNLTVGYSAGSGSGSGGSSNTYIGPYTGYNTNGAGSNNTWVGSYNTSGSSFTAYNHTIVLGSHTYATADYQCVIGGSGYRYLLGGATDDSATTLQVNGPAYLGRSPVTSTLGYHSSYEVFTYAALQICQNALSSQPNAFTGIYIEGGSPDENQRAQIAFGTRLYGGQSKISSRLGSGGKGYLDFMCVGAAAAPLNTILTLDGQSKDATFGGNVIIPLTYHLTAGSVKIGDNTVPHNANGTAGISFSDTSIVAIQADGNQIILSTNEDPSGIGNRDETRPGVKLQLDSTGSYGRFAVYTQNVSVDTEYAVIAIREDNSFHVAGSQFWEDSSGLTTNVSINGDVGVMNLTGYYECQGNVGATDSFTTGDGRTAYFVGGIFTGVF